VSKLYENASCQLVTKSAIDGILETLLLRLAGRQYTSEFRFLSSVECRGSNVEVEGKKSRVKSRGSYKRVEGRQLLTIKEFLKRSVENFGVKTFSRYVNHKLGENLI
jgi:hypothetical protein